MSKLSNTNLLISLFFVLVIILSYRPYYIKYMYQTFLGRILLVIVVLFFALNSATLGLLVALIFIIFSSMFLNREGLDNMDIDITKSEKEKEDSIPEPVSETIDLETIKNSIQSKPSSTLPVQPASSSEDVAGATKETFKSMYQSF